MTTSSIEISPPDEVIIGGVPDQPFEIALEVQAGMSIDIDHYPSDVSVIEIGTGSGGGAGGPGESAYQVWLDAGNSGTVEDFLESLVGADGKSAYESWLEGHEGTEGDFIEFLIGPPGPTEVSGDDGNVATLGSDGKVFVPPSAGDSWTAPNYASENLPEAAPVGEVAFDTDLGRLVINTNEEWQRVAFHNELTSHEGAANPHPQYFRIGTTAPLAASNGTFGVIDIDGEDAEGPDRLQFRVFAGGSWRLTSWFNEYGEFRVLPSSSNRVANRAFVADTSSGFTARSSSVPVWEVLNYRNGEGSRQTVVGVYKAKMDVNTELNVSGKTSTSQFAIGGRNITVGPTPPGSPAPGDIHILTEE